MLGRTIAVVAVLTLTGCSVGPWTNASTVTIGFTATGTGAGYTATVREVRAFERENPRIRVNILQMSPASNLAYVQLAGKLGDGIPYPDVISSDVVWIGTLVKNGWILPLDGFHPDKSRFYPTQYAAASFGGRLYALPWFIDAEGLFYRTDLGLDRPSTPGQLVDEARAAQRAGIKYGLAFEAMKFEGLVTDFIDFGGTVDLKHLDSPQNVSVLQFMHDLVYTQHVAPPDVTRWQENEVRDAFVTGQAAFAIDWPFVYADAEAPPPTSVVAGKTAWMPFPAVEGGQPQAALGGWDLVINARSQHPDEAYKLIEYLLRTGVQVNRAVSAGNPPGVVDAYQEKSGLFRQAPYYRMEPEVFRYATPRPATSRYPEVSDALQSQLAEAMNDRATPAQALAAAQRQIDAIQAGSG